MASKIDTIIAGCHSWSDFVKLVNSQDKTVAKGDLFERLTQLYLKTHPIYQSKLKDVYWLKHDDIPASTRTYLNLPANDEGIDLICETHAGEFWSVQCKYKADYDRALTHKEISTFTSLSFNTCKHIKLGLVAHTSTKKIKKSALLTNVTEIGLEKWLEISDTDWTRIIEACRSKKLKPPKKLEPKPHQQKAIEEAKRYFVENNQRRGKLIMPCGTGKSLTAFWIARALNARTIIVAVPSLALIRQSLSDWTAQYLAHDIIPDWLVVCSDETVGSTTDADSTVATVYETGIPTNPTDEEFDQFLTRPSKVPKIIFTTYQSAGKLCEASKRCNVTHDLLIADEAHKTVGHKSKSFATLLFDKNISINRRLFMTATERAYRERTDEVVSMNDPTIYGETLHQLSFREAIKEEIICDYKIVTVSVSDAEILQQEKASEHIVLSKNNKEFETDRHNLIAGIAIQKAYDLYGIKHTITFHSSISRANNFRNQQDYLTSGLGVVNSHISSKFSAGARARLLNDFARAEKSLITNARCLTEGVDIRSVDCVAFIDPKKSVVDIVQAAGRAMRQSKETGKTCGYIVIPVNIPTNQNLEEFFSSDQFSMIIKIVSALSTQDERIVEEIRLKSEANVSSASDNILKIDESIVLNSEIKIEDFERSVTTALWSRIAKANWKSFRDSQEYVRALGLKSIQGWLEWAKSSQRPPDIPSNPHKIYRFDGWKSLGDFIGIGQHLRGDNFWSFLEARSYVRSLNFQSVAALRAARRNGLIPAEVPSSPNNVYPEWVSWGDWLGTYREADGTKDLLPFEDARKFARSLKLKSSEEFAEHLRNNPHPRLVRVCDRVYAEHGWISWADFLGDESNHRRSKTKLTYEEAREFLADKNIESVADYSVKLRKHGWEFLYVAPDRAYKMRGWINWAQYLSADLTRQNLRKGISRSGAPFLSFEEARAFAQKLNLSNVKDWHSFSKSQRPNYIPSNPDKVYKNQGWVSWFDFLGVDEKPEDAWNKGYSSQGVKFLSFKEARDFARKLKLKSAQEWRDWARRSRPPNMPFSPDAAYKHSGWKSWPDFLGKNNVSTSRLLVNHKKLE